MEQLLEKLNQNYDVATHGVFENMLHQTVARVVICNKAYSIRQQADDTYEVVYSEVNTEAVQLPSVQPDVSFYTVPNLSSEEVVGLITKLSNEYLLTLVNNPIISKHNINI